MTSRIVLRNGGQDLINTLKAFSEHAKVLGPVCHSRIRYVVFMCGTMVDVRETCGKDPITSFHETELDSFLRRDFPDHRLPDTTYEETRADNEVDLQWSQTHTGYPAECAQAYGCLMWSGYPLPGGLGGDSVTYKFGNVNIVTLPHLGECCFTVSSLQDTYEANMDGVERRRFDYMFPKVFACIDKEWNIHTVI